MAILERSKYMPPRFTGHMVDLANYLDIDIPVKI